MEVPSLPHLLMVLIIFALLFGAKRVPEIAGSVGKGIKEFKRNIREETRDLSNGIHDTDSPPRSVSLAEKNSANEELQPEPRRLIL